MRSLAVAVTLLFLGLPELGSLLADESAKLAGLEAPVDVYFDAHGIPHIYAQSWTDAACALGYLHASDRLFQMEVLRRGANGQTAELMGPDLVETDIHMRLMGLRRSSEELWAQDDLPAEFRAELEAYAVGVNARMAELKPSEMPPGFQEAGIRPAPWTPVDSLAFNKFMGLDQSGTMDDLWMSMLIERLGQVQVDELWPIDRPYEVPIVEHQTDRTKLAAAARCPVPAGLEATCKLLLERGSRIQSFARGPHFGSNNWAVDGSKTASGKPALANDPHLGFSLPSLWYTVHLSVKGKNLAGVSFPTSPLVVIGHNDRIGWGFTNMQADAMDYFSEKISDQDPRKYTHRGETKSLRRIQEEIKVRGAPPRKLDLDFTVHGPLVPGLPNPVSVQWTGHGPTRDAIALWKLSRAGNLQEYLAALDELAVPAMNVVYADVDGHIAIHPCGKLPRRAKGQGRGVVDGSTGEFDWKEFIPRAELPLAVDPASHFVASANGRPQALDDPHYLGWAWDPSYRTRRIHQLLSEARALDLDSLKAIQYDHYDLCAESFLPTLLAAVKQKPHDDPLARMAIHELEEWKYQCTVESVAPTIWAQWFNLYRSQVWDDEWESRGIERADGSWGFSGNNRREPMLEVLERMTREEPRSQWFDHRGTPLVEDRDAIAQESFRQTLAQLRMKFSNDPANWKWGKINLLHVDSLLPRPELARDGGPVVGNDFTLNPGGNLGQVGSGASWRMLVDFADTRQSVGVYPGGQSENPASPQYADQMPLWARGEYTRLYAIGTAAELPAEARARHLALTP